MQNPIISVIVPIYNNEKYIGRCIRSLLAQNFPRSQFEIIVIDDGSTDQTAKLAKQSGADRVISHNYNKGLGTTFKRGIEEALQMEGDIIVNIDADGQFNPADILKLTLPIINKDAEMVTCTRFAVKEDIPNMPLIKNVGNRIFTKLISILTGQKFTDTQCGFRAYSKEAALRMNLSGNFTYTQEVILDLSKKSLLLYKR